MEPFTQDGAMMRLRKFIVSNDEVRSKLFLAVSRFTCQTVQSINVIESPHFRELLVYYSHGRITEDEIPGRTCMTEDIMKAWKEEQDKFSKEMNVRQTYPIC